MAVAEIIEQVEKLSVLELNELVKSLEEKWGVSAAAPVAVAAAPAGGGGGAAAAPAEQTELMQHYRSLDPELTRLTLAVAQHSNDRANARLLGAQDLVWALINSPAFLFNH